MAVTAFQNCTEQWLFLRCPRLALESLQGHTEQPAAVIQQRQILLCNDAAAAAGVTTELSINTASALCPALKIYQRDTHREQAVLKKLAAAAYRFTPTLSINHEQNCPGIWLEVSGSLKLFGGLPALLCELQQLPQELNLSLHMGLAPTPYAAQLLSFQSLVSDNSTQTLQRLEACPVKYLDLPDRTLQRFAKLGFERLSQILALPRSALGKRFGKDLVDYLEQLLGEQPTPLAHFQPPEYFSSSYRSLDGIYSKSGLLFPMKNLLQQLCRFLLTRQGVCQSLQWRLEPFHGDSVEVQLELSSLQNQSGSLLELCRLKLERLELPESIETITLKSSRWQAAEPQALTLFKELIDEPSADNALLDKLNARLGPEAIQRFSLQESHLPEQAWTTPQEGSPAPASHSLSTRPLWLFGSPQRLRKQHKKLYWNGELLLISPAERIEGEWWQQLAERDYFIARHNSGAIHWVFHDRINDHWYSHGLFA